MSKRTRRDSMFQSPKDLTMLAHLMHYIRPHWVSLLSAAIFLFLMIGMDLVRPLLLKYTIDHAFVDKNIQLLITIASIYLGTIVVGFMASFLQSYLLKLFGQRIIYDIRNDVFRKILTQDKAAFDAVPLGNWVTRITNDAESLRSLFTDVILNLVTSVVLLLGILVFLYIISPELALLTACIIPIMGWITVVYRKYSRKAFRGVRSKVAESNAYVQEVLNFIIIIKTYLGERIVAKRYNDVSQAYLQAGLYEVKTFAIFRPIVDTLYFLIVIAILAFTNWGDTLLDAGTVFAALQYVQKIFTPLKDIAEKYNMLQQSMAGAERLVPILEEPDHLTTEAISVPAIWQPIHEIAFEHVWFAYEGDNYVLKDINFVLRGGDFLGIAGPSGSGKSTMLSLLMGFQRPTKGRITINGYDTADFSPQVIRELVGYVFQDSHLFKGSIRENLALYEPETSEETLVGALREAHLYDMVQRLPQGLDTPVGYLGSLLSGGQKQLLALARALVKRKPILVFDEATAQIDSDTERLIQESIAERRGEHTIISIAHRLSTIRDADTILLVKEGEIVERGSFSDLLMAEGAFYQLWSNMDATN